jgi:glycosyltransferase involved in cell wall biosynthesis
MGKSVTFINETGKWGGGEAVLSMLAKGLHRRGWEVEVFLPEEGKLSQVLKYDNIHYTFIPGAPKLSTSFYLNYSQKLPNPLAFAGNTITGIIWKNKIIKNLELNRPSLVHTTSLWAHAWGGKAAKEMGIPVIAHIQDLVRPTSGFSFYRKIFINWATRIPDQIVCISPLVREQFNEIRFKNQPKVILNSIDTHFFKPLDRVSEVSKDSIVIGTTARITYWKGHVECLQAARELKMAGIGFSWIFAGDTALGSEKYYAYLLSLVNQWELNDVIHFDGWIKNMPDFYQKLDVLVHIPNEPEPFGLAIAEGMACGLPVITSRGGGTQNLIETGGGILVSPGDYQQVARELMILAKNPEERKNRSVLARKLATDTFDLDKTIDQWLQVYDHVMKENET